jgi:hypothetical protein
LPLTPSERPIAESGAKIDGAQKIGRDDRLPAYGRAPDQSILASVHFADYLISPILGGSAATLQRL